MTKSLLTIIIPTLNEENNLSTLLPYLNSYKDEYTEIIVVDASCSNDQCALVCDNNHVERVTCNQASRAAQMNRGAKVAKGDIFYFLHADARPPKTFINDIRVTLVDDNDIGIFSYRFDKDSVLLRINAKFTRKKGVFSGGGDQSICIKKETFDSLGGFDTRFCIMEDFRLFHQAKKKGLKYRVIPHDLTISARKYEKNSYLRVNITNLMAFSMYYLGSKPENIKKMYGYMLKN